ncbi:hypothetical protein KOW79_006026 [Hemibagrus wyckioides]|uniref:Uncharacterized protein n=1 Tax=Hemibagrus wyckioides TaxID=337641 RepID=A0A9D3NX34_9TELE|nr:hypothetical protein KOW79_006026 [Hemibagrus wyckioides]
MGRGPSLALLALSCQTGAKSTRDSEDLQVVGKWRLPLHHALSPGRGGETTRTERRRKETPQSSSNATPWLSEIRLRTLISWTRWRIDRINGSAWRRLKGEHHLTDR